MLPVFNSTHKVENLVLLPQVTEFLDAGARQWAFLVKGLQDIPGKLEAYNIPFYMMLGKPEDNIPKLVEDIGASLVVCDYVPLHEAQAWRTDASILHNMFTYAKHICWASLLELPIMHSLAASLYRNTICIVVLVNDCCEASLTHLLQVSVSEQARLRQKN